MTEQITKIRGPRFDQREILPVVPEGKVLAKFHGMPVLLTAIRPGEPMLGNSIFSETQADELRAYETARLRAIEEGIDVRQVFEDMLTTTDGLDPDDPSTSALRHAVAERPISAIAKTPRDGVLLIPGRDAIISNVAQAA